MRVRNGSGRDTEKGISGNGIDLCPGPCQTQIGLSQGENPPLRAPWCLANPDVTFIRKSFDWLSPDQQAGAAVYLGLL